MSPDGTATVRVQMLDNTIHTYDVKIKSFANVLLQAIIKDLNLLEADYFGILYSDRSGIDNYLDPLKNIKVQIPNINNVVLKFAVKFFPPDPGQLHEEYTRYFFALQLKQDISHGLLHCNHNTLSVLASYIAQSEFGDWNPAECSDLTYLKDLEILPEETLSQELLQKISELHKTTMGQSPADADLHLLDIARKLESYGVRLHPARDHENTEIYLAVAHMGVVVFRGHSKINTFNWARIRKLSFKKKRFLVKLKTEANNHRQNVGDILVFVMMSRDACKAFWRHCIECHAFFRLEIHPEPKPQPRIFKRGSTFRYSGKTQKQLHDLVRNSNFRRTAFVRASSRKSTSRRAPSWTPTPVVAPTTLPVDATGDVVHPTSDAISPSPETEVEANGRIVNESEISSVTENQHQTKEDYHDSSLAAQSWQIESENLHSNVVVSNAQHQAVAEKADLPYEDKEDDTQPNSPVKSSENLSSSSVHLHSGGTLEDVNASYDIGAASTLSDNSSILPASPTALPSPNTTPMSTRGLRSTSSLTELRSSAQAYFVAKEILTTERTYIKDLEVINTWFKNAIQNADSSLIPENIANQLFGGTGSLLAIHKQFLLNLEERLSSWEGRGGGNDQRVDDVMRNHMLVLSKYLESLENGEYLISALEELGINNPKFESVYREFELQKVCYLPFNSFLLKPMQRVTHYKIVLDSLLRYTSPQRSPELEPALREAAMLVTATQERLKKAHNVQKIAQLRRDLIGVDFLLNPTRIFMREGSLYKLSRKGFQQRLFFLFSDCLLYTSKGVTMTNQFKVHAELPLKGMIIEINEGESAIPNCFSILSGDKTVIVAAASQEEMNKWLEDFSVAIAKAGRDASEYQSPLSKGGRDSMNRLSMEHSSEDGDGSVRNSMERLKIPPQQRSNATMHVCWHRNTSVSSSDHLLSLQNQLSGYLLRKFKNSDGWQKLWVVFTNFCLFFYKSHQDESPLASLPLLGYTINPPAEVDSIRKEFVFKLQFKTHVYFFRAESQYTYNRWYQVVSSATVTSQRTRLFSRMDSSNQAS